MSKKIKLGDIVWCVDLDTTKWEYFVGGLFYKKRGCRKTL